MITITKPIEQVFLSVTNQSILFEFFQKLEKGLFIFLFLILSSSLPGLEMSALATSCCDRTVTNTTECHDGQLYVVWLSNSQTNAYFKGSNYSWSSCNGQVVFTAYGLTSPQAVGETIDIQVTYSGYTTTPPSGSPKANDCGNYSAFGWEYYTQTSGAIISSKYGTLPLSRRGPAFQVGQGANTQSLSFGASGWFNVSDGTKYWTEGDVNVNLSGCICNLDITTVATNAKCYGNNNGSIDLTVISGVAPYTYKWSNTKTTEDITGLTAGNYTVTVTDANGCTKVKTTSVGQPPKFTLSVKTYAPSCAGGNNGSIDLSVAGASSPYKYIWSNGATVQDINNLAAGTYTVTVTDSYQCTEVISGTISAPPALVVTGNVVCAAGYGGTGSIDVSVSGGVSPYSYYWSTGAVSQDLSGMPVGCYTVTVTDSKGCKSYYSGCVCHPSDCSGFRTQTQGGWGQESNGEGGNPGEYLFANFAGAFPSGLTIGCTKTLRLTSAQAVADFLPSGSTPRVLEGNYTNPGQSYNNVLAGQLVAATLSVTFDLYDASFGSSSQNLKNLIAGSGALAGLTVEQILAEANKLIGGCGSIYTIDDIYYALSSINENYVGGKVTGMYLTCCNIAVTCSNKPVSCYGGNDGTASVNITGGTSPFTYKWNNNGTTATITNLVAGTYSVTVTDKNGCTSTCQTTVSQPTQALSASININGVIDCYGACTGALDLTVTGGTSPYTYNWSNGKTTQDLSALCAGTYTVTVTDKNGCTVKSSKTIGQPTKITVSVSVKDVNCYGGADGSVDITVTGGTSPYTYLWSNGKTTQDILGLVAGSYSITVTDSKGCKEIKSGIIVNQPAAALTVSGTVTNVKCYGGKDGAIDVSVSGGTSPYSYIWNTGATTQDLSGLSAGTYSVTVTDKNGCTEKLSKTVNQPTKLDLTAVVKDVNCYGGKDGSIDLTVAGGTSPYTYLWSTGATTQDISGLMAGTYTVTVTDNNGCTEKLSKTVNQPQTPLS